MDEKELNTNEEITKYENGSVEHTQEDEKDNQYEDVCFVCHRPESKAGKMIHLTKDISICAECMQRTMDMMNNGQIDYSKMYFSKMPCFLYIRFSL